MSAAQDAAAIAARKACIAWMRSAFDVRESELAAHAAWREWSQELPYAHEIKSAYLAAWRTTWETA